MKCSIGCCKRTMAVVLFSGLALFSSSACGGVIGLDDFGPDAVTEGYEGTLSATTLHTPVVIGGDTYLSRGGECFVTKYGWTIGTTGNVLSTVIELGYFDITLSEPMFRVGLVAGKWGNRGGHEVEFFDENSSLLGTVVTGGGGGGYFTGWEADDDLIARVRVTDTTEDGATLFMDDFVREAGEPLPRPPDPVPVPEPTSLAMWAGLGVMGLVAARRRRRKC